MSSNKGFTEFLRKIKPGIWKYLIIAMLLLLSILFFKKVLILVILLILSVIVSFLVGVYNLRAYGIELSTFVTIISGYALGPAWGGSIGAISMIMHLVLSQALGVYIVWVIPGIVIAGVLAGMLNFISITTLGVVIIISLQAANIMLTSLVNPENLPKYMMHVAGNTALNLILILKLSSLVLQAVG